MYVDVTELRDFYARPLGGVVRRLIGHRIRAKWRNVSGRTVIGLGFASPYLGPYQGEALRLGAFMPAAQGALVWPRSGLTQSALVDDEALPLRDESVDFLLAAHCLDRPRAGCCWWFQIGGVFGHAPNRRRLGMAVPTAAASSNRF